MPDDNDRYRRAVAFGTEPHPGPLQAARRAFDRDPDIRAERGLARNDEVIVTEAYDESDGTSRVRHAGEDPRLHQILLTERAQLQRHRVSEEQRSRRTLAWLATALLLGAAAILALGPQTANVYLGAAFLAAASGGFGIKSFRIKVKDFEFDAGESPAPPAGRDHG